MAISTEIEYVALDRLLLDPKNPRLGRRHTESGLSQAAILALIEQWSVEELAVSFLQNGFWPQEALIVIIDPDVDSERYVVAEGNRRLGALKLLHAAYEGRPASPKWSGIAQGSAPDGLFTRIPTIRAESRSEIDTYIGFRHVTGIKEWAPGEKAEYIARLVDQGMSYTDVMRAIGSKTPTVRQNYISHKIFRQLEGVEDIDLSLVEGRFSLLFLAIREHGVQEFLGIDPKAEPDQAQAPVPVDRLDNLGWFVRWVFGNEDRDPLFTDSRKMGSFAEVLTSGEAIEYLKSARRPTLSAAMERAGTDHEEVLGRLQAATDELELALSTVHLYATRPAVEASVARLAEGFRVLLNSFPRVRAEFAKALGDSGDAVATD